MVKVEAEQLRLGAKRVLFEALHLAAAKQARWEPNRAQCPQVHLYRSSRPEPCELNEDNHHHQQKQNEKYRADPCPLGLVYPCCWFRKNWGIHRQVLQSVDDQIFARSIRTIYFDPVPFSE